MNDLHQTEQKTSTVCLPHHVYIYRIFSQYNELTSSALAQTNLSFGKGLALGYSTKYKNESW